ncbi:MAG TPA: C40 family peptidase [Gemmatimonadaceae bacterium]|nr:C40 family peptidase [Gemmatimonadaceae bacterium]
MRGILVTIAAFAASGCVVPPAVVGAPSPVSTAADGRLTVNGPAAPAASSPAVVTPPTPERLVVATADDLVGTPYRYGGDSPARGFDCSGFVRWVYAQQGIELPRTARAMASAGTRVPARRAVLRPGDLLLFAEHGRITHVAIFVGDGRIVHASSGRRVVRYDDLDSARGKWFRRHVVSARRVILADAPALSAATEAR